MVLCVYVCVPSEAKREHQISWSWSCLIQESKLRSSGKEASTQPLSHLSNPVTRTQVDLENSFPPSKKTVLHVHFPDALLLRMSVCTAVVSRSERFRLIFTVVQIC